MKFIIATLGCKVNQYETQAMETILRSAGHTPASAGEADAVIVNTCAVTAESVRKTRQTIRRLRTQNPGAILAVCGCLSQVSPGEVEALGADLVFGSGDHAGFLKELESICAAGRAGDSAAAVHIANAEERRLFEKLPAGAIGGRKRAYLKIQDGCDNFCAYCIIPYARGRARSLPLQDCAALSSSLAAQGYREFVVTGIEIASYGKDLEEGTTLADALDAISEAAPRVRLHLGSLEPRLVTEDFCRRLLSVGRLCRHFHLSLQSGCDETLRRMGRRYDTARFLESVHLLRSCFPDCGLTADLIVGFPGETEEEFAQTLSFIQKCDFSALHIFPYSRRPGTRAYALEGQVPKTVKSQRAARAKAVADAMEDDYLHRCVGRTLEVLFETEDGGVCTGHGENYRLVSVEGRHLCGLVGNVEIKGVSGKMLVGDLV
jgi:threonylcarbamoyladenosine tRNA methylthiotransferase MtaB